MSSYTRKHLLIGALVFAAIAFGAITTSAQDASAELAALRTENEKLRTENETLKITVRGQLKTITALNKQIADLKAPAASPPVQKESDEITKAINEHRIVNGMTIEQANKSLSVEFRQELDSPDGAVYTAVFGWNMSPMMQLPGGRIRGGVQTGTLFTIWVKDRVVVNWTREPYLKVPPYGG